jgi:hypothetical protein
VRGGAAALVVLGVGLLGGAAVALSSSKAKAAAEVTPKPGETYTVRFDLESAGQPIPDAALLEGATGFEARAKEFGELRKAVAVRLSETKVELFFVIAFRDTNPGTMRPGMKIDLGFMSMTLGEIQSGDHAPSTPVPGTDLLHWAP